MQRPEPTPIACTLDPQAMDPRLTAFEPVTYDALREDPR